jgi:hypothetical protein
MFRAKISLGLLRKLALTYNIKNIEVPDHEAEDAERDGDVYIRIHLGWKALAVFGAFLAQTALSILSDQYNLF